MLRLMVLTTSFPIYSGSANGVFVKRYIDKMPSDWSITVITPDGSSHVVQNDHRIYIRPARYAVKSMQRLANVPGGIMPTIKRNPFYLFLVPLMLLSLLLNAMKEARNHDLIHANWAITGVIASIVSRIYGIPFVTTLRGDDANRARTSRLFHWMLWCATSRASSITGVSSAIVQQVKEIFPDVADRVSLIANGVGDEYLKIAAMRFSQPAGSDHILRILTISNLVPRKSVDILLNACGVLLRAGTPFLLTIGGAGVEFHRLLSLSKELGLERNVEFVGHIEPKNIPSLMVQHDVFVLASRSEGRANVLLEAMATAMTVVATDIPGTQELILNNETGLLFPVGNYEVLAEILATLAKDIELRYLLGRNASQSIVTQGLTWESTATNYDSLFKAVIAAS